MSTSNINHFDHGSNQSGMRAYNERLVLTLVRRHSALPKSDIAKMTGLSAQTVSVIMRQLEADGILKRGEKIRVKGKVGQPSTPMSLSANGALFFGLKIGRRSADLVLIDFLGNLIDEMHETYEYPLPDAIVKFSLEAMETITLKLSKKLQSRISGLGIGLPYQLWNWADFIDAPQNLMDSWRQFNIHSKIASKCSFPVYIENDMSAACAAELVFGHSTNSRDFLYFYIGFLIGGGIVINNNLFTGESGNAGALGSIPVPTDKGIQQLINVASIATLQKLIEATGSSTEALWSSPENWDFDKAIVNQWINDSAKGIAYAIMSASAVIDFKTIIINGYLPQSIRADIVNAVKNEMRKINNAGLNAPLIREGSIGINARAIGAASLPLSNRFLVDKNALTLD